MALAAFFYLRKMVKHSAHIIGNLNNSSLAFKKYTLLFITLISFCLSILIFSGTVFADTITNCYQEYSNVSTSCGGFNTGSYVVVNNEFFINYTKPIGALNSSLWTIRNWNSTSVSYNLTIPKSCWDYNSKNLQLKIDIGSDAGVGSYSSSNASCYDGSWKKVGDTRDGSFDFLGGVSSSNLMYDGSWSTGVTYRDGFGWRTIEANEVGIYEEGMSWNLTDNFIFWNENVTYNMTSFETKHETFSLNISWNNNTFSSINATFYYNNTKYYPYSIKTLNNITRFTIELDAPLVNKKLNNTFYWTINATYLNVTSYYRNTSFYNQTVNPITFSRCNSTLTQSYLNISFSDELTLAKISEVLILSTNYSLGENSPSTIQKTLYMDSGTELNGSYSFCFSNPNESLFLNQFNARYSALAASPSYAERNYLLDSYPLFNITNNLTLYSLSTSGIYVTITTQDTTGNILTDVNERITTLIGGVILFTVGQDISDTSGQTVFFLNPLADHTLYLNKTGCISRTISLRPSLSSFTYQLDCGNAGVPLITPFIGSSEGISFRGVPASGPIYGSTIFGLRVYSSKYNINAIRLELVNTNFSSFLAVTKVVDNITCYPQDCRVNFTYDPNNSTKLKGRYLVNITLINGTTAWYILEQDAYWTRYIPVANNQSNIKNAWKDFAAIFDNWNSYTGTAEEANRAEFSRIIFIFLILSMLIAVFNKFTGYDSANPGAFLGLLTALFWLGSLAGGRSCGTPGFFYLSGLFGTDSHTSGTTIICDSFARYMLNNYIIAISVLLIFLTYILNVQRRNS